MVQDATKINYRTWHTPLAKRIEIAILSIAAAVLASCGNANNETYLVDRPYLSSNGSGTGAQKKLASDTPSEFGQLQREMLGDQNPNSAAAPKVDEFTAALDDFLADPNKVAGENPASTDTASSGRTQSESPDSGKSKVDRAAASLQEQTVTKIEESANDRPEITWNQVSSSPSERDATPADRKEKVGSANDPLRNQDSSLLAANGTPSASASTSAADSETNAGDGTDTTKNDPTHSLKSFSREQLLVMLSARLHRDVAYSSVPLREYIAEASMLVLDPSRRINPDELYDLNDRERKLLSALQGFFIDLGQNLEDTRDPETIVDAVNKLARGLGSSDLLQIPQFKLCTSVQSFGNFDTIDSTSFIRGRPREVITYIEVANFKPLPTQDGRYKTTLTQEAELYTESDGTIVFRQSAVTAEDYCRNIRRDFFLVRHLTLPANLSVGSYYLKVRVKDESTQQEAEALIPIKIVAS